MSALWDGLFWTLVLLALGWLVLFVFRAITRRRGGFLEVLQALLGWSVAVVAFAYAALFIIFVAGVVSVLGWE